MNICIFDDTEYVLELLQRRLKDHNVQVFTQPEQFLASISDKTEIIITDLRAPRYDAIKHIRKFKEKNITVKVIVMSAYFDEDILISLIDCHIFSAVKKTHEIDWIDKIIEAINK